MDYVKIAEDLPTLVAQVIYSHVGKQLDITCMTVTGKLQVNLVDVTLVIDLNHTLEVDEPCADPSTLKSSGEEIHDTDLKALEERKHDAETKVTSEDGSLEKQGSNDVTELEASKLLEEQEMVVSDSQACPPNTDDISETNISKSPVKKCTKMVSENRNISRQKGVQIERNLASPLRKDTPIESATSLAKNLGKSPAKKSNNDSKISFTKSTKDKRVANQQVSTTRSGRTITKPKHIWNAEMHAGEIGITPRQGGARTSKIKTKLSNVDVENEIGDSDVMVGDDEKEENIDGVVVKKELDMNAIEEENTEEDNDAKPAVKQYKCGLCSMAFKSDLNLTRHRSKVHKLVKQEERGKTKELLACEYCGKTFKRKQSLQEHMFVHDKNTPYKCDSCDKTFATQGKLTKHNRLWHSSESEGKRRSFADDLPPPTLEDDSLAKLSTEKCHLCKRLLEVYASPVEVTCPTCRLEVVPPPLEGAIICQDEESKEVVGYKCYYCEDQEFTGDEEVMRGHIQEKHHDLLKQDCPFCEMRFIHEETLNLHLLQQHPNRHCKRKTLVDEEGNSHDVTLARWRKMYYCGPCNKIYHTRIRLSDHISVHHEGKPPPYPCNSCDRRFLHKDVLTQHVRFTHASEWFKVCDQCGKFFRKKCEFESHRHSDDPWRCEVCDRPFTSYSGFRMHMKKHQELPSLMCKFCGQMFHYRSFLRNHERLHTGEKPFQCSKCDRKFSNMYVFNKHKKRHTDRKIKCPSCPQTFLYPSDLQNHEKIHSKDRTRYACTICNSTYFKLASLKTHTREKHQLNMLNMTLETVEEQVATNQEVEQVTMEIDLNQAPKKAITLYSCQTCNCCYYTEEECLTCQISHGNDSEQA